MDHRKTYLNGLSRTKLQKLAKKYPGVKANWKSQTIRERLLDPRYNIEIPALGPAEASASQKYRLPSVTVESEASAQSKRKQADVSVTDRLSKRHRSASVPSTSLVALLQEMPDVVPPRHGRSRSRGVSVGPTLHKPDAITTTSGPTPLYEARDCSSHGVLSPVLEDEEYSSQRWEAVTPREFSIAVVTSVQNHHTQETVTATTSTGKRAQRDTGDDDDENQLRSRARRRLEAGDIPRIPAAQKGKAKMTAEEFDAWKWDEKVQLILELINRGRKDQADARARKLQEQQYEAKQRQKRIHLAGRALFAMMVELGPDFGPVFSSTCDYLRTCIQSKRAVTTAPQFVPQGPDIRASGPSTSLIGYDQEKLHAVSQAASAIAELHEKGYTMQDIMTVVFSPR
ncbi:hypothetical protein PILCRDRAFT_821509 [Piloderma croceum F 1598]|uniref:Uncharacterized protein n=1 Tax=Piloderma croceum (strain F 1598) TaxID=765440 RepID=A0A0C3BVL6_PILCF|nr:hypothetical protein PILCRDRAFT_821509 [Piloderma croceum F 1598]